MRFIGLLGCILALGAAGCGGDDDTDGDNGTTHQFACDVGSGTDQHYCYEFQWNGPENAAQSYQGVCSSSGATTVTTCPSTGKVGGCKWTASSGGVAVTWIGWFYFGTAAENMAGCVGSGSVNATWVNP